MDGSIAVEDRAKCEPLPLVVQSEGLVDMTTENNTVASMASSSSSAAGALAIVGDEGDEGMDDGIDDDAASAGGASSGAGLMCGSSFAMGVVPEQNRSPTPLMLGNGESPESSVGGADDDSFVGGHSPTPAITGAGLGASGSSGFSSARRSLGSAAANAATTPNAPQLPADVDVLNDELGDLLKAAILTTIDDLRRRKARPNLKNIGHMMLRRHGCSPRQVEALLEFLVERDIVIKVDYKGQASYRNASKWKKGHILKGTIMNPAHISRLVLEAVAELERRVPTQAGVHPDDIEMLVLARAAQHQWPMNKQKFLEAVTREVDLGRLQKLRNGFFRLNETAAAAAAGGSASSSSNQGGPTPSAAHSNANSNCNIISPLSIQRGPPSMVVPPSNRTSLGSNSGSSGMTPIKHSPNSSNFNAAHSRRSPADKHNRLSPPKMYEAGLLGQASSSSSIEPSMKRQKMATTPSAGSEGAAAMNFSNQSQAHSPSLQKLASMCRICSLSLSGPAPSSSMRGLGASSNNNQDMTLTCATCRFSVHAACAGYSTEQAIRYRETGWMCQSCRTCTFCGFGPGTAPGENNQLVVCDQCDRSYHMGCHIPSILTPPGKGAKWLCSACDVHPMMLGTRYNRAGVSAAHVQAQQSQPQAHSNGNGKASSSQHRSTPNGSMSSGNASSGARSAGDVTPPPSGATSSINGLLNGNANHRLSNGAASRTAIGGLPTPSGSGESTDEDISGAQFMPSGPVPPVPAGLSERIAEWSIADVATYFRSAGFPDQARLVSDQEIDGAALLLLKRDDIIHELGFKLGPALKVYQIVAALQRKTVANTCLGVGPAGDAVGSDVLVGSD